MERIYDETFLNIFKDIFPSDKFMNGANFDIENPYIIICNNEYSSIEYKILIPEPIAYYLRTHFCGSMKMHESLKEDGRQEIRNKIKKVLQIKD